MRCRCVGKCVDTSVRYCGIVAVATDRKILLRRNIRWSRKSLFVLPPFCSGHGSSCCGIISNLQTPIPQRRPGGPLRILICLQKSKSCLGRTADPRDRLEIPSVHSYCIVPWRGPNEKSMINTIDTCQSQIHFKRSSVRRELWGKRNAGKQLLLREWEGRKTKSEQVDLLLLLSTGGLICQSLPLYVLTTAQLCQQGRRKGW